MSLVWQQWAFLVFAVLEVLCTVGVIVWIVLTSLVFSI